MTPASLYPPDQPLGEADVCKLLGGISPKTLRRRRIKHTGRGQTSVFLWKWVVEFLEKSAA